VPAMAATGRFPQELPVEPAGGGGGPDEDDPWDGWEFWGPDDGWNPPSGRSRVLRVAALVTSAVVVVSSFGMGIAIVARGHPNEPAPSSVPVRVASEGPSATRPTETIRFSVSNSSSRPSQVRCEATLGTGLVPNGARGAVTAEVPGHRRTELSIVLALHSIARRPRAVAMHCVSVPSGR
jgi:hypothetical protein